MSKLPNDVAIRINDVHKDFYLPHNNEDSIKHRVITAFQKKDKSVDINHALRGVGFDIKKGEFFGVVGRNGSGKSTLLKIISKIYQPTSGTADFQGKLVAFIELGVGFKAQLSGRDNVYLNAAMLGFTRKEIDVMYDEIVDFAELKDFMSLDLKNYSSGMKVRLAFSVAIRAKADILILDEVLAVGDAAFRKKCNDYFKTMKDSGRTIVLVTHSMADVKQFCNKAILIEDGKITHEGPAIEVADEYTKLFAENKPTDAVPEEKDKLQNVTVESHVAADLIRLDLSIEAAESLKDPVLTILINQDSKQVYRWVSDENIDEQIVLGLKSSLRGTLELQNVFPVGEYTVDISVKRSDRGAIYGKYNNVSSFRITADPQYPHRKLWRPIEQFSLKEHKESIK